MLNITGLVKITKMEDMENSKCTKACIYFGTKKGKNSDEWENSFFNVVLVGSAYEKIGAVGEKDSIFVTSGLVKNVSYEDKQGKSRSYLSLTIFDFIHGEEEISEHIGNLSPKKEEKPQKQSRPQKQEKSGRARR